MSVPSTILRDLRAARHRELALATADWNRGSAGLRRHKAGDVFLGYQEDGTPLGVPDDRHILLVAGTRAGKGASVIIPNLSIYGGSVVVLDPKGENAIVTARRRANGSRYCRGMGQKVVLLDPFHAVHTTEDDFLDLRGGFNPLDLVDPARPESIGDAGRIADSIGNTETSKDPFFDESARALTKVVICEVASSKAYPPEQKNLVTVFRLLQEGDPSRNAIAAMSGGRKRDTGGLALLFKAMQRNPAFGGAVARAGKMFGDLDAKASRTMANIAQVACANLEFVENPEMARCLSHSSLALSELKTDARGVSLFLSLPQAYMGTHYRWMRMISTLLIAEMERHRFQPYSGRPVLMVLDEFAALKRMSVIENAAAQIAGFGVRMVFAVQTLAQLRDVYKDNWETLVANSGVKLFFGNDDHFTRDYVSKLVGETEVIRTLTTVSETQGTSRSTAAGETRGDTFTETWGVSTGTQSASSSKGGSYASAFSRTTTQTDGTSQSRTVAHAESIHKRALLTPDEVGRHFGNRSQPMALVLVSGQQPLAIERRSYYRMDWLAGCYGWHPDHVRPETLAARAARQQRENEKRQLEADMLRRQQALLDAREARRRAAEDEAAHQDARWQRRKELGITTLSAAVVMAAGWSVLQLVGLWMIPVVAIRIRSADELPRPSITGFRLSRDVPLRPTQLFARIAVAAVMGLVAQGIQQTPQAKAGFTKQRDALVWSMSGWTASIRTAAKLH